MKERTNHMEYMEGMEVIDSTLLDEVISAMDAYDYDKYTDKDVENALGISQATAILLLRELVNDGLLVREGKTKNLRYYEKK